MGVEYELKFAATEAVQKRIRDALEGWVPYEMRTTYYDTPDGSLSARKWTLRHRLENDTHVCTLKTPAGSARGEWEAECPDIREAIPLLCKLGAPAALADLTEAGVEPVCGAAFTRLAATVEYDGAVLEVALDRGTLFAGERSEPLCEVEVELKAGQPAAADTFARALAVLFGLKPLGSSKFKRALALRR